MEFTLANVVRGAVWLQTSMDNDTRGTARDPRFAALRHDDWTCQGCGCRSSPCDEDLWAGLEVHHKDDNPDNQTLANLATLCPLCHGLMHCDLMLEQGLLPGRFLWSERIPQRFLTLYVHVRAVVDVRCARLAEQGIVHAHEARSTEEERMLRIRERCEEVDRALARCTLAGVTLTLRGRRYDLAEVLDGREAALGLVLGRLVRTGSREERARAAARLRPLRWLCDWRRHPKARVYAQSEVWGSASEWAGQWLAETRRLLGRAGLSQ